jgi:hypothetical protein
VFSSPLQCRIGWRLERCQPCGLCDIEEEFQQETNMILNGRIIANALIEGGLVTESRQAFKFPTAKPLALQYFA